MPHRTPSLLVRYERYLASAAGVNAYNAFRKWVYQQRDPVVEVFDSVVGPLITSESKVIRMLDLGAGDGRRSMQFAERIARRTGRKVLATLVDQSNVLLNLARRVRLPKGVRRSFLTGRIDEGHWRSPQDIIIACHSLFTTPPRRVATVTHRTLGTGGLFVAVSNRDTGFVGPLKRDLDGAIWKQARYEIGDLSEAMTSFSRVAEVQFSPEWSVPNSKLTAFSEVVLQWLSLGRQRKLDRAEYAALVGRIRMAGDAVGGSASRYSEREQLIVFRRKP